MYLAELETNVKGYLRIELAPLTVIVGPNASHKSGLKAAINLVLEGRCEEHGAQESEIRTLAPSEDKSLFVRAVLKEAPENALAEDGLGAPDLSASYTIEGTTAKAHKPVWLPGHALGTMLDRAVLEMLAGKSRAGSVRDELLRTIAPRDCLKAALRQIPTAFHLDWDKFVESAKDEIAKEEKTDPGAVVEADALVRAADLVKAALRKANAVAKDSEQVSKPDAISDDEFAFLEKKAVEVTAVREWYRAQFAATFRRDSLDKEIADAQAAAEISKSSEYMPKEKLDRMIAKANALDVLRKILGADKACPLCLTANFDLAAAIKFGQDVNTYVAELKAINEKAGKSEPAVRLANLLEEDAALKIIAAEPRPACQIGIENREQAEHALGVISEQVNTAKKGREAVDEWKRLRANAADSIKKIPTLTALKIAADSAVKHVLADEIAKFEAKASAFLPGRQIGVQLFDGAKAVCRVGIREGVTVRPLKNLAGEQRIAAVCAIAAALGSGRVETVKMVAVDDVWLEEFNVRRLCVGLEAGVGHGLTQAIVFVVTLSDAAERELFNSGWKIHRLPKTFEVDPNEDDLGGLDGACGHGSALLPDDV